MKYCCLPRIFNTDGRLAVGGGGGRGDGAAASAAACCVPGIKYSTHRFRAYRYIIPAVFVFFWEHVPYRFGGGKEQYDSCKIYTKRTVVEEVDPPIIPCVASFEKRLE